MKKVLITGAVGQDGLILSKLFTKKKFKVFGFVKKGQKFINKNVSYKINDLKSKSKIKKDLKVIEPNIILHLASSNNSYSVRKKKDNYKFSYLQNLIFTKNLLESILENQMRPRFIFAGSSLMFGKGYKKRVSETDKFKSKEYYGMYKIDSYKIISSLNKKKKINATTAILFNHDSIYRNSKFIIPKLIKSFENKDINFIKAIYKLNISGDFSHAEDICNGLFKLSISKKNIDKIILSSGRRFHINSIITFLEKKYKTKIIKNAKKGSNPQLIGSNLLAKKLLGYRPRNDKLSVCKDIIKNF